MNTVRTEIINSNNINKKIKHACLAKSSNGMKKVQVNEEVVVSSLGFRKNLVAYPRRMEYRGATYNFIDAGLRCLVRQGEKITEVITLSDGKADYCLRSYNRGCDWTLLSIAS